MAKKKKNRRVLSCKPVIWTEGRVRAEAKKYETLRDFYRNCESAYNVARKKGWLSSYTWLKRVRRVPWTEDSVLEESKKYCCSLEFLENCESGWRYAKKTGVFDKITWFIDKTPEFIRWMYGIQDRVYNLLITIGLSATKEWLFVESGKADVYTHDQCRLLRRWSENVNEKWASWKKYRWYYYDDMDYDKRRERGDREEDMDDGLHIKP